MVRITYPGVYVEELHTRAPRIEGVATSTAAFVGTAAEGPADEAIHVHALSEWEQVFGRSPEADPMRLAVQMFFANGGSDAVVVRVDGELTPEPITRGLTALGSDDRFDLLCLPGLYPAAPPTSIPDVAAALELASVFCETRGAILLIDPPPDWRAAEDIVSGPISIDAITTAVRRDNAAVFFPNLLVATPTGSAACAPSGAIAGVMARTDRTRGIWKVPAGAGAAIAGATGVAAALNETGASMLRDVGVNPIREFPGLGIVPWGSRLLANRPSGEGEWKYIPIRRLVLYIEHSLDEGLAWTVFEPNGEPLWAAVREAVGNFLESLFQQGAFVGQLSHEAYFVNCDRDTMTQADIDAGILNVLVGFAPSRPAEFVIIRIHRRLT